MKGISKVWYMLLGLMVASLPIASYATGPTLTFDDTSFTAVLDTIWTAVQSMFTDVIPYVVIVAGALILIRLVKRFTKTV